VQVSWFVKALFAHDDRIREPYEWVDALGGDALHTDKYYLVLNGNNRMALRKCLDDNWGVCFFFLFLRREPFVASSKHRSLRDKASKSKTAMIHSNIFLGTTCEVD